MMRVRNSAWNWRERVNFKRRFKGGDRGPFVRQDELSTQGVYVKVLWLVMASRRGGKCNLLPQGLELAARQGSGPASASNQFDKDRHIRS